jgi:hypothetical protein
MKYLASVVLFISLLFACETELEEMSESISLKGAYILTHIMIDNQLEAVDASKVSLNTNTKTIAFYVTGSLEGRFMGHTLNNGSGMEYKLISKNKLKLFNFGGTRAGEGRYGLALMNHIGSHDLFHYTLTKDRLVISDTLDTELIVFQKQFVPGELPAASQISGLWEVFELSIAGQMTSPGPMQAEDNWFEHMIFQISEKEQSILNIHGFNSFLFMQTNQEQDGRIRIIKDGFIGGVLDDNEPHDMALYEILDDIAKYQIIGNSLVLMDSLDHQLLLLVRKN